jgi:hypothetical protein
MKRRRQMEPIKVKLEFSDDTIQELELWIKRLEEASRCNGACSCGKEPEALESRKENPQPEKEAEKPLKKEKPPETEVAITMEQMKHAAATVSKTLGSSEPVKKRIAEYAEGGDKLSNVPPEKYVKLLEALDELTDDPFEGGSE